MIRRLAAITSYFLLGLAVVLLCIGILNTFLREGNPLKIWLEERRSQLSDSIEVLKEAGHGEVEAPGDPSKMGAILRQYQEAHGVRGASHAYSGDAFDDFCTVDRAIPDDDLSGVPIYSWVDDAGITNFSDGRPEDRASQLRTYRGGPAEFKANIVTEGVYVSDLIKGQIIAGAKRIYDQWGEWLGYDRLRRSHLNVRIIGDYGRYSAAYGAADPPAGFYRPSTNEAVLLFDPNRMTESRLSALAFHEVSHLVLAWHVGSALPWFNEGLAEYFETMSVQAQSASFGLAPETIKFVSSVGRVPLHALMGMSRTEWYGANSSKNYASAGLIFAFLQSEESGATTSRESRGATLRC